MKIYKEGSYDVGIASVKVVKAQSLQIDIVSGATVSSMVILKSIENALKLGKS
jgi:uncharacterized protein with FMN-binding domain